MIKALLAKVGRKLRRAWPGKPRPQVEPVLEAAQAQPKAENVLPSSNGSRTQKERETRRRRDKDATKSRRRKKPEWTPAEFPVDPIEGKSRFHDFLLPADLMHGIADLDFKYCTPIQEKALPAALEGKDIIGRAGTGTGKSAVFLIAILARLLSDRTAPRRPGFPRALIIAPTRELVIQIAKDGKALARHIPLCIAAVYGGTEYQKQEQLLVEQPADVVVATPGRLLDYISRKVVSLDQTSIMVIDEADRMLDMGFIPDVRRIISKTLPKEQRQTMLFSATLSEDVRHLASQWCVRPLCIESDPDQVAVETVKQIVYTVTSEEKYAVLYNLLVGQPHERVMVFANMKSEAARLYDRLRSNGIEAVLLTGDVPQDKRMARLERFRDGRAKVMIATDVAGRGIHIEGISHVVNYTLPHEPEDYVHRIGRTGRAGESGISVSFACEEGAFVLPDIEEYIGRPLSCSLPEDHLLTPPPVAQAASTNRNGKGGRR